MVSVLVVVCVVLAEESKAVSKQTPVVRYIATNSLPHGNVQQVRCRGCGEQANNTLAQYDNQGTPVAFHSWCGDHACAVAIANGCHV